ncbi:MAG: type I-U CRISPR-associated protein Cas7 [Thermoanaerobaculaceae bacterium]|mgnify:CR=1 FL=1|nr:type I-U CRISPR-associated protein Cas7 [Thermoanaerobaculaceae bacterium]MDI9621810.1 type I-U CRISPR-associated RAMP protein Csb1/Cas7u [Acidobacteriota bacterium]HPW54475.1 type I-U CRISPR-associated RAMP protein Csb1/Cas7u [Thermoanaerobaculaceae bacterium]
MAENPETLTLGTLQQAVAGTAAAFRCITEHQPAGGPGDKVFPPTYEGGKYAVETRVINGQRVQCVLLDSVQSQANRMELALLNAVRNRRIKLPLLVAKFDDKQLLRKFTVSSLEAPHRIADAIFRDSLYKGVIFRRSEKGQLLDTADLRKATGLFGLCPTALLLGLWDSTGPRGGLGAKFQRALVSEIVGIDAEPGKKTSSRIDPAQVLLDAGPLHTRKKESAQSPDWTLDSTLGPKLGKEGKPSEANHGNVTPGISDGGFTFRYALQTTVLSLPALRRLRFPLNGAEESSSQVDGAARTVLVALGLLAGVLAREDGADLRSRCHLVPQTSPIWELLDTPGDVPRRFAVTGNEAVELFNTALIEAQQAGLPWEEEIELEPSADLVELVRRSQQLAAERREGAD